MTLVYMDTSALLKRAFAEVHSDGLRTALAMVHADGGDLVSSALARIEVSRALRTRLDHSAPADLARAAEDSLAGIATAPLSGPVLESARIIGPPVLRTLDAIHLATAVALAVDEVWTYDARMATVAEELGIPVRTPE